ncbi:MAG TPA: hypothetical protein VKX49_25905 [Bryobacteraceae bacterium]|nr:hypothetical protein [Bryobacteraceae bacterium]
MDDDRKYRQRGYMDSDRDRDGRDRRPADRPKPSGPRPPIDVTGPRLPRLLQTVVAARCFNCATALPADVDWKGKCPKCSVALHCCKQCAHFEPSTRFQCLKPVPQRIAGKDQANECELFSPRVTVARDAAPANNNHAAPAVQAPRSPNDARAAFDSLFKKP